MTEKKKKAGQSKPVANQAVQPTTPQSNDDQPKIQFHVSPELEYVYRDVFNVYAGIGEVVIELGNLHRAMPGHASISNRIVVSIGNAYTLIQTLQQALQQAQVNLQRSLQQNK